MSGEFVVGVSSTGGRPVFHLLCNDLKQVAGLPGRTQPPVAQHEMGLALSARYALGVYM